jgi:hypothetical protein
LISSRAVVAAIALAAAGSGRAASDRDAWYVPDQAKLQFAGNIGFFSPGVGYAWAGGRLEGDLFFGWVPSDVGGSDIFSLTGKLTWFPWRLSLERRWVFYPLSTLLQLTYTLGDELFVVPPGRYEHGYYDFPTAFRAGIGFGGALAREGRGALREVGLYWELVALDAMLVFWARNRHEIDADDVFSLARGVRATF